MNKINKSKGYKVIKISNKMMKIKFHPCTKKYIKSTCFGRCCHSSTGSAKVSIENNLIDRFKKRKQKVVKGLLVINNKVCLFFDKSFCTLHDTRDKPFGCIVSPFKLNKNDTLIVRHRYISMICHRQGTKPVYKVHKKSLILVFGKEQAKKISLRLNKSSDDFSVKILIKKYDVLKERETIYKKTKVV